VPGIGGSFLVLWESLKKQKAPVFAGAFDRIKF